MEEQQGIGGISNYYGGLVIAKKDGKFYWMIVDDEEVFDDVSKYEEIPEELFNQLKKFEENRNQK